MATRLVYHRDQLIMLSKLKIISEISPQIPMELKRKRRGCRAGVRQREKRWRFKPFLPTVVMGNVRSLANKIDELRVLTRSQKEYRECSIMCFTETWLHEHIPDCNASVHGFMTVRADRNKQLSGKLEVELQCWLTSVGVILDMSLLKRRSAQETLNC